MKLSHRSLLILIICLAVLVRVAAALYLGDRVESLPGTADQISYDALAKSLVAGNGYQFDVAWYPFTPAHTPTSHWSFLYPAYLAATYLLFGYHPLVARLLQAMMAGALTCWLVYRLGRRVGGPRVGLVAAAMTAFYGYFVYYNAALMTESFHIVLVFSALDLTAQLGDRVSLTDHRPASADLWRWGLLGLMVGSAVLQRQATLIFAPVLFVWILWRYRKSMRAALLGGLLSIALIAALIVPWTIRNYTVFHRFLLLNSNAGFAFFWANHPQYGFGDTLPSYELGPVPPLPPEAAGRNEAQIDRLLTSTGLRFVLDDPGHFLRRVVGRIPAFFLFYPLPESGLLSNLTRVFSFGITMPFMIAGLVLARRELRRHGVVLLFVATYTLIHLASWPSARYRLPIDAVMLPFAALALVRLWQRPVFSFRRDAVARPQ